MEEQQRLRKEIEKENEEKEMSEILKYKVTGKFDQDKFNEKYTQEIQRYIQKFEEMKKIKQDKEVVGVTFKPEIFTKGHQPIVSTKRRF